MIELSPAQKSAIQYVNGPLLVLAGAGSGKTSLLIHKIAWLIREYGVSPQHIAAITFTYGAGRALRRRIAQAADGQPLLDLAISTFHALGYTLMRDRLTQVGYRPGVSIYDAEDSQAVLAKLMRADFPAHLRAVHAIQFRISQWKRAAVQPEPPADDSGSPEHIAAQLYPLYERELRASNAMDVDDLVLKPVELLRQGGVLGTGGDFPIRHLLVDEYEETTRCQHELVRLLAAQGAVLTAAADDDQAIFERDGALPENIVRLRHDFPGLKIVRLEQNFRSGGRIVKAANTLIAHNPHSQLKSLWSERAYGDALRVIKARTEEHEAEAIVGDLLQHKYTHGTDFRNYAVLFRRAAQAAPIARALRERRVPYHVDGGDSLFERTEVKDVLSYLQLLCNPADDNAFVRVVNTPRRAIDRGTLDTLARYAAQIGAPLLEAASHPSLDAIVPGDRLAVLRAFTAWLQEMLARTRKEDPIQLVCDVLAQLRYEDWLRDTCNDQKIAEHRMHNVMQLLARLQRLARAQPGGGLCELLASLSLIRLLDQDTADNTGDSVTLTTVHAVKGGEFDHVYMAGMEDGLFPCAEALGGDPLVAERRLAYVGMTRARYTLTFTLAERRRRGGEVGAGTPSPFLHELPQNELNWQDSGGTKGPGSPLGRADTYLANLRAMRRDS